MRWSLSDNWYSRDKVYQFEMNQGTIYRILTEILQISKIIFAYKFNLYLEHETYRK